MRRWFFVFFMTLTTAVASGCGEEGSGNTAGSEGERCYPNGTCNVGLACEGSVCVATGSEVDAAASDALGDVGNTADVVDASDSLDFGEASDSADAADMTDVVPEVVPTVVALAPDAGDYVLGDVIELRWESSDADDVVISLVDAGECRLGAEGVVLPELAVLEAAAERYDWEVPVSQAPGEYRIRLVASRDALQGVGCSEVFALVQPPQCDDLNCGASNRICPSESGEVVCAGCVDGYVEQSVDCIPVDCGAVPGAPSNAVLSEVNSTRFGGIVTYTCDAGYTTTGVAGASATVTRRCGSVGAWEEVSGACLPVDCGALFSPSNGSVSAPVTTLGAVATYECGEGYVLQGSDTRTCDASGAWGGAAPTCAPVDCGALSSPSNGSVSAPVTTLDAVATYECGEGYVLHGGDTRTCDTSGAWSGAAPTCLPVDCGALSSPSNGSVSAPVTTLGAVATYECGEGYVLQGSDTRTCGASGAWSGAAPSCVPVDCGAPPAVSNGSRAFTTTTLGSTASYTCNSGYTISGTASLTCSATGSWGSAPRCVLPLGVPCTADSECPSGSWCSTVEGFERCSPRLFSGQPHELDFVYVPAGTFEQGTPGATNEEQPYTATLTRSYFVSRTEVTQGQWKAATGGVNPSCIQNVVGEIFACTTSNSNDNGPVDSIAWYSALAYANWLSSQNGLEQCYTLSDCSDSSTGWYDGVHSGCTSATFTGLGCTGYRLLTESEWERAARGGTTSTYYWGDATDAATVEQYGWFLSNSGFRTQAVGQKVMNAYGLYDMSGNVGEFVWDWVHTSSAWIPYPSGNATDYLGESSGSFRGCRGGGFFDSASDARSANRTFCSPAGRGIEGFRLARTVP